MTIARYDETIRFNITLTDRSLAAIQPYRDGVRGLEAPTFVLRSSGESTGLFPTSASGRRRLDVEVKGRLLRQKPAGLTAGRCASRVTGVYAHDQEGEGSTWLVRSAH